VATDHDRRVGVREKLNTRQKVVGGSAQRILICAPVDLLTHQLLGSGVGNRPDRHVGGGEPTNVVHVACNPEVGQQDPLLVIVVIEMGEHDVRRFDVAVQQPLLVCVVKRTGHGGNDVHDLIGWHSRGEPAGKQASCIQAIDVVHRNPELAVVLASVVHADDVGMPQV